MMPLSQNYFEKVREVGWGAILKKLGLTAKPVGCGRVSKMRCVFHKEKHASLYFLRAKNIYFCFGCGESGTNLLFVQKYRRYSNRQTVSFFKRHFGIKPEKFKLNHGIERVSEETEPFTENIDDSASANKQVQHNTIEDEDLPF